MHQAKTHLSRLVEEVARKGESVVIARHGQPVARLAPLHDSIHTNRSAGLFRGQIWENNRQWPSC